MTFRLVNSIRTVLGTAWALALLVSSAIPAPALAFESQLPVAGGTQFVASVQLAGRPIEGEPRLWAGRDPYLTAAIDTLPDYQYVESGHVVAHASPVTEEAQWADEIPFAPVVAADPSEYAAGYMLVLQGEASFYSRAGCLGCNPLRIMANGQPLDDNALTMAIGANHKHLVGYKARVTSLATGKSAEVRITDTGGFSQEKYRNRVADLTFATNQAIGMAGGVGLVRVEVFYT